MNKKSKCVIVVCLIAILVITKCVILNETMQMDIVFYDFLKKFIMNDYVTKFMKFITWFGSAGCFITISILLFFLIKDKKISLSICGNLIIIAIFNYSLKTIFKRSRPQFNSISGYSYPSGHSMVSMAFYGYLIYLINKNVKNKYLKISLISFLFLLIILIGLSRIYLGVHYLSDVLVGFLISIIYLIIMIYLINRRWFNA